MNGNEPVVEDRAHIDARRSGIQRVVVLGGANTDIAGFAAAPLIARDSNPGHVRVSAGGVARNVAENLARLGVATRLVTAFGDDHNARELMTICRGAGIDIADSLVVTGVPGSVYLSIMDDDGDMSLALNDMRALDALTPDALALRMHVFEQAGLVVADANLPAESLVWLADNVGAPLMIDAVSVAKVGRVASILPRLRTLKANGLEVGLLLGRDVRNRDHAEEAARELVSLGVGSAFVTAGAFGTAWADSEGSGRLPAPSVVEVRNATGAGDAFAAGVAYATLMAWPTRRAAALGSACAALTLESEQTVSAHMGLALATSRMEEMTA